MAKPIKKKASSRARYERSHPTVSCRVSKEVHDRLKAVSKIEGRSFADILKVGLGILESQVKSKAEIEKQGYDSGYVDGYEEGYFDARLYYRVTYPCNVCGDMLEVTTTKAKEVIAEYMKEHRWGHKECHEKRRL